MPEAGTHRSELKNTGYEIFIGILSVLSIFNLVLLYAIQDDGLDTVLFFMNAILSGVFLVDFTYRLFTAESKTHYFFRMFGWADLLASLPFQQVKILRVFRLVRVFRLLRAYGVKNIARSLLRDRAGSALLTLLLMGILVMEFGSLEILHIEQDAPGANITTASDALWYNIVTISTVGYGDRYPVTNDGRIVGSLIIIIGVGIFGTFTGYLANLFLAPSKKTGCRATTGAARRCTGRRRTAQGTDGPATDSHRRDQPSPPGRTNLRPASLNVKHRMPNAQVGRLSPTPAPTDARHQRRSRAVTPSNAGGVERVVRRVEVFVPTGSGDPQHDVHHDGQDQGPEHHRLPRDEQADPPVLRPNIGTRRRERCEASCHAVGGFGERS